MKSVSVCMPFRGDGGIRDEVNRWVDARWNLLFPDFEFIKADNEGVFSRAEARNQAAEKANGDLLLFADADTFCPYAQVERALTAHARGVTFLYDTYYNANRSLTKLLLESSTASEPDEATVIRDSDHVIHDAVSGLFLISRREFQDVGGYDTRFTGWGYEDNAFFIRAETLLFRSKRVNGFCVHLDHGPTERFEQPNIEENRKLFRAYQRAAGNVEKMRTL